MTALALADVGAKVSGPPSVPAAATLHYEDARSAIYHGDCMDVLAALPDNCIDLVPADPPYGLSRQRPDDIPACLREWAAGRPYQPRAKRGFGGHEWDSWVSGPETWRAVFRVLKPGAHVFCFAGTRNMDLASISLRLAEFELRDTIVGGGGPVAAWAYSTGLPKSLDVSKAIDKRLGVTRRVVGREKIAHDIRGGSYEKGGGKGFERDITVATSAEAQRWSGWGTALKPGWEPIIIARKPLDGTVASTVMKHGTGGLNIAGCRLDGRWPFNVLLDGSLPSGVVHCAKASSAERADCGHPTVKPLALLRHLIRLACPKDGIVLDPFAGSGTTIEAALLERCFAIGIERDIAWLPAIVGRIARGSEVRPQAGQAISVTTSTETLRSVLPIPDAVPRIPRPWEGNMANGKQTAEATIAQAYARLGGADHIVLTSEQVAAAHSAMRSLAGMDGDRATLENHKGFSKGDSSLGHLLAKCNVLAKREAILAQDLVRHYRVQLDGVIVADALGERRPYCPPPLPKSLADALASVKNLRPAAPAPIAPPPPAEQLEALRQILFTLGQDGGIQTADKSLCMSTWIAHRTLPASKAAVALDLASRYRDRLPVALVSAALGEPVAAEVAEVAIPAPATPAPVARRGPGRPPNMNALSQSVRNKMWRDSKGMRGLEIPGYLYERFVRIRDEQGDDTRTLLARALTALEKQVSEKA